jgi:hypothetical protein
VQAFLFICIVGIVGFGIFVAIFDDHLGEDFWIKFSFKPVCAAMNGQRITNFLLGSKSTLVIIVPVWSGLQPFSDVRDIDETPAVRHFKPKMFCQRFHACWTQAVIF